MFLVVVEATFQPQRECVDLDQLGRPPIEFQVRGRQNARVRLSLRSAMPAVLTAPTVVASRPRCWAKRCALSGSLQSLCACVSHGR